MERFNRIAKYEWLSQHYRESISKVQGLSTLRMYKYIHQHPIMGLEGIIPKQRLAMVA